jgi:hypothetical protein
MKECPFIQVTNSESILLSIPTSKPNECPYTKQYWSYG